MPRVTIHVISFRVIRSRALDLELASHSTSSARERIVDETRERSTALDMSTAEASTQVNIWAGTSPPPGRPKDFVVSSE